MDLQRDLSAAGIVLILLLILTPSESITLTADTSENGYFIGVEGSTVSLVCINNPYPGKHLWKYDSKTVAVCNRTACNADRLYNDEFIFENDMVNGVFHWTIKAFKIKYNKKNFKCSDGTETLRLTAKFKHCECDSCKLCFTICSIVAASTVFYIVVKIITIVGYLNFVLASFNNKDILTASWATITLLVGIIGLAVLNNHCDRCKECKNCFDISRVNVCLAVVTACFIVMKRTGLISALQSWTQTVGSGSFEIPKSSLRLRKKISEGSFGKVWKGTWDRGWMRKSKVVAIKILKRGTMDPEAFLKEADVMKLSHPNIMTLLGVCTKKEPYYIVMDHMKRGSLLSFLRSKGGGQLKLSERIHIATQISSGMAHLVSNHFVHCDLAARNILHVDGFTVKIADFGLTKKITGDIEIRGDVKADIRWTAPEVFQLSLLSTKSDVWSFGVVLFEIVTFGEHPYADIDDDITVLQKVGNENYRMKRPKGCPPELYSIMLTCWEKDFQARPTFEKLKTELNECKYMFKT